MRLSGPDIAAIADDRLRAMTADRERWTTMSKIYSGKHRELFPREFPKGDVDKIAGFIKRSWRMFARMVAKVPDIQVAPLTLRDEDVARAEKQEMICFAYNSEWRMRRKMQALAHYFVGFGAVGVGVFPDALRRTPKLLVEDPRNVLPGPSWEASTIGEVDLFGQTQSLSATPGEVLIDCIVRKAMTGDQLVAAFGLDNPSVRDAVGSATDAKSLSANHVVLMYYDESHVTSVLRSNGGVLAQSRHDVGWCPWQMATIFSPGGEAAVSDLEQQIGLEVAFVRLLNQKLALNDAVAYPWLFTRGVTKIDPASRHIKAGSPDAQAQFMTPPAAFQVDRDMSMLRDLLRVLNFESEASQGSVEGGPITARGLVELGRATVDVVQEMFDDLAHYLSGVYTTALRMDAKLFGGQSKSMSGQGRGEPFFDSYDPATDIGDSFGRVTNEFGPGLGGFEGHLQMLQDLGADAISVESVMEKNPHIRSISKEKRRIELSKLNSFFFEQVLTGQSAVSPDWIAQAYDAVGGGQSFMEFAVANPPTQSTATAGGTAPVPPELAAQMQAAGGLPSGEEEMVPEEGGERMFAPPLQSLMGGGA